MTSPVCVRRLSLRRENVLSRLTVGPPATWSADRAESALPQRCDRQFSGGLCKRYLSHRHPPDAAIRSHRSRRAAGDIQQITEKHRCPACALTEMSHQQLGEGCQAGTTLAGRHSRQQARARCDAAARAVTTEKLIFDDDRFDRRQVPDLVTPSSGTVRPQRSTAAASGIGVARRDGGALLAGNQFAEVPLVSILPALLPLIRRRTLPFWLACGCSVLGGSEQLPGVSFLIWSVGDGSVKGDQGGSRKRGQVV